MVAANWAEALPETDGLITNVPEVPLVILVADCVPLYLFDPVQRVAGLVHAGRQGTFDNIAGTAIANMRAAYGTHPRDVHAVIGPSAGPDAYEVSESMANDWRDAGLPANGRLLDLWRANVPATRRRGGPCRPRPHHRPLHHRQPLVLLLPRR